eukprot:SAG22_NODE_7355_length_748_cov_0.975347_2_plen_70_part_01
MTLFNYGLSDIGNMQMLHHERHPCSADDTCTEAAMERFEVTRSTIYEIKFEATAIGLDVLASGQQFGFGI